MAQTNYTPLTWSIALLKRLNSPVNHQTVQAVLGWVNAEGGNWHNDAKFNPLNTTMPAPGAGNTGSQGNIKVYTSWNQGLDATVRTLKNGLYGGILGALKQGKSAGAVGSAITASPWGTGGLAARVISATKVPANLPNVQPVAQPVTAATSPAHTAGTPATTRTVTTDPNQAARGAAIRSFLFDKSIQPTDFASQVAALQPVTTKITTPGTPASNTKPQVQGKGLTSVMPQSVPKATGTGVFKGVTVAAWIVPILKYASAHGWNGTVSSGFRTFAQQKAIYDSGVRPAAVPGTSNHEGTQFPRGAVDVTNASGLSSVLQNSPYAHVLIYAGSKDPVHFSHPHNGGY